MINLIELFKKEHLLNIKAKLSKSNTNSELVQIYKGLVIKLKISTNIQDSFFKLNKNILLSNKIPIKNILIYKSDISLNLSSLRSNFKSLVLDNNELIVNFLENYLIKSDINLIFCIGCGIEDNIKEVFLSYNLYYFEWLNWKNYQVRKIIC